MAKTLKYYRIGSRLPRYTTKLNAFSNGMYLTNQLIPEGYTKVMVNYDIDDTGSCLRPKRGREKVQVLNRVPGELGAVCLTDYVYAYNSAETEVTDIKDVVLSYGVYTTLKNLASAGNYSYTRPIYVSSLLETLDTTVYYLDENGNYQVQEPGGISAKNINEFWALAYNKEQEQFESVTNRDIGYTTARTIENAYAFEKPFVGPVGRPIGTVLDNELIAFTGGKLTYNKYASNPERNELLNFSTPKLTKLNIVNQSNGTIIKRREMSARKLNPLEASASGYNMLSLDPYTFEDERGGSLAITGMLPYDITDNTRPLFNAKLGTPFTLRTYYQYPTANQTIKYKIETLDMTVSDSNWEVLEDFTHSFQSGDAFYYTITPKSTEFIVRVTLRVGDDTTTEYPAVRSFTTANTAYDNLDGATFDLSTCKGMVSWQKCVGVYGVENALDTIFFSDIEDPGYFPYPNNTIQLDNEILAVHNYLDHLIVVTVDSIWLLSAGGLIQNTVQKRILANLYIPEIDAINLVVLKDQIFFKTDTQFYVLKPNQYTSDSTDLKNYINSTAIANYTKNFKEETVKILNKVFVHTWQGLTDQYRTQVRFKDFNVYDTRSVVRDEEVHYIYTIKPIFDYEAFVDPDYINLHLVYNTLTRSWRMYLVAIGNDSVNYAPILYRNKQSGAYYEFFPHDIDGTYSQIVVSKQTYSQVTDNLVDGDWSLTERYNSFPYIDTGNIALDDSNTRRFRECQLNFVNMEKIMIRFYADFIVDGQEREHATRYITQHITDVNDPDYGKIWVLPTECTNVDLVGQTTLANDTTEADFWALDLSKFPDLNTTTVRFQLQGRGRRGALQLLNTSLQRYELADINWVYRNMSAR